MDLYRSIEGLLKRHNGVVSFDEAYEFLENDYSEKTIKDFLGRNRKYFHFDGSAISSYQVKIDLFLADLKALVLKFRPGANNLKNTVLSTLLKHIDLSSDNDVFLKGTAEQLDEGFFLVDVEDDLNWDFEFFSTPEKKYLFTSQLFKFLLNEEFGGYGLFTTPHTLTELFKELLPAKQKFNLYNPTAGFLNLVAGLSVYSGSDMKIKASEINKTIYEYGKLFAVVNKLNVDYSCTDSGDEVMDLTPHYYDVIVGNLPFSLKEKSPYGECRRFAETSLHIIYESLGKLSVNSRAIFLINDGILFSQAKEKFNFRKVIVDSGMLKAIIALPSKILPQSPVNTSLLIFEKGKKNDKIQFIDASSESLSYLNPDKSISLKADRIATLINRENGGDKQEINEPAVNYGNVEVEFIIPITEIQVHEYDLSSGRYKANKELTGKEYTELKTVLKVKQTQTVKENTRLPFIRISDLNGKSIERNSNLSYNTTLSKGKHLNEPAILIGKIGNSYKPTWFTGDFDVEISNNIGVFDYDEKKVFPPYLVQELNADYVQRQLNLLSKGSAMKHITVDEILSVRVKLLPLEEQIKLASDRASYAEAHMLQEKND